MTSSESNPERPWAGSPAAEFARLGREALERADRSQLEGVMEELRSHRTTKRAKPILAGLEEAGADLLRDEPDPSWFDEVKRIAAEFEPNTEGDCCVYLVLLSEQDDQYGVYVGESALSPEDRFAKHKSGHRGSKHVQKRGIRLIPVPHLQGMHRDESTSIEKKLIRRLEKAGFIAHGG